MAQPKRIKGISDRTASLLREGESELADFKRVPEGISTDDLVAFANSEAGGILFAGIDERAGPGGAQIGIVIGCDVSDAAILQIANKALSCLPPVAIGVHIENLSDMPFLRIDVRPSSTKPHCTPKGVYCRRDGTRNRPLHPSELLKLFLESEARAFAERFEAAAKRITEDLQQLETNLEASISEMSSQLGWADSKLGDTESTLNTILAHAHQLNIEAQDLTTRLRALFRQDKRQDPVYDRERRKALEGIVEQLKADRQLLKNITVGGSFKISAEGKSADELTQDDFKLIFHEALKIVGDQLEREQYSLEVKKPADCTGDELQDFAKLIAEGGEVAEEGIGRRLKNAIVLGLIRHEKKLVGTAALKSPAPGYRKGVFEKAKASIASDDFPRELGWVFLKQEHRSKGQMRSLIKSLMEHGKGSGIFATTRVSNEKMRRILEDQRFVREGTSYASKENVGEQLALFVRPGSKLAQQPKPSV